MAEREHLSDEMKASLERGIAQAERGELVDRGSFAEYRKTYAPTWRVECNWPRCTWFSEGIATSDLEDEWEAHDAEHQGEN